MDYVLLSPNDGELLKKAHQMLLDGGVKDDVVWNTYFNPDISDYTEALLIRCTGPRLMQFHNHGCKGDTKIPIHLTPENLTEAVTTVLNAYKQAQK